MRRLKERSQIFVYSVLILFLLFQSVYAQTDLDLKYQEEDNYCGIALMQTFVPYLTQVEIARELHKWRFDLTYWGDFNYIFDRYGVKYHYGSLGEEFPSIVILDGNTFGFKENHFVLVLGKRNSFYYIFDPEIGFYKKAETFLDGKKAIVVE